MLNPADSLADGDVVTLAASEDERRASDARARAWLLRCGAGRGGCAVGPDYHKPAAEVPPAWQPEAPWHEAAPDDAALKGEWWRLFQDDALESAGGARARRQSGLARRCRAARAGAGSGDRRALGVVSVRWACPPMRPAARLRRTVPLSRVWGAEPVHRAKQFRGRAHASITRWICSAGCAARWRAPAPRRSRREADFENTRLVLTAHLVTDYFALRELDAEIAVVRHSLDLQRDALGFITSRHDLGFATGLDLAQQQALVDSSATQLELLINQRAQFEHAIATLVGTPAPGFALPAQAASRVAAGDSAGTAVGFVAAPPGRRLRRTLHGRRQCAHRRGARRLLPQHHSGHGIRRAKRRMAEQCVVDSVRRAEPALVDRAVRDPDIVRCRENPRECALRDGRLQCGRGHLPADGADRHGRGGKRHYRVGLAGPGSDPGRCQRQECAGGFRHRDRRATRAGSIPIWK